MLSIDYYMADRDNDNDTSLWLFFVESSAQDKHVRLVECRDCEVREEKT